MTHSVTITPARQAVLLLIQSHKQQPKTHTTSSKNDHKKQNQKPTNKAFDTQRLLNKTDLSKRQSDQMRRDCHIVRLGSRTS